MYGLLPANQKALADIAAEHKAAAVPPIIPGSDDDFLKVGSQPAVEYNAYTELAAQEAQALADAVTEDLKYVDLIIYWINIIRTSVVNNALNPLFGPPIIRLRHGIMYQNIPCICQSYSIDWDERMGYDLKTLLPRRLNVTMKLEELRTGNFGTFEHTAVMLDRDNLGGWEAVLNKPATMDPGYL